jgi:hypothetical protein
MDSNHLLTCERWKDKCKARPRKVYSKNNGRARSPSACMHGSCAAAQRSASTQRKLQQSSKQRCVGTAGRERAVGILLLPLTSDRIASIMRRLPAPRCASSDFPNMAHSGSRRAGKAKHAGGGKCRLPPAASGAALLLDPNQPRAHAQGWHSCLAIREPNHGKSLFLLCIWAAGSEDGRFHAGPLFCVFGMGSGVIYGIGTGDNGFGPAMG